MDDLTQKAYNLIAKDWHADHQNDDWWIEGVNKFISLLRPGDAVLDVGCAGGWKMKYLTDKGLNVVGVDISESMITIAKETVPQAKFFVADMRNLKDVPGQFSGVFASAVLLHIPKKEISNVLKQVKSKLQPKGYFYLAVKEVRPGNPEEEVVTENDYGYSYSRFFSYFATDEIERYLKDAGMEIVYEDTAYSNKTRWIQVIAH